MGRNDHRHVGDTIQGIDCIKEFLPFRETCFTNYCMCIEAVACHLQILLGPCVDICSMLCPARTVATLRP